ncbi:MAG TPA: hypothetical protein VMF62_12700 [Acetobacteraceae bacterium]|nr:hypothetical protein [Acetobacteraceae bacterium]
MKLGSTRHTGVVHVEIGTQQFPAQIVSGDHTVAPHRIRAG